MQANSQHINQLLEGCRRGKQSAQLEIYKAYYKAMYNTAYRILNDSFEAEDIMQESFLSAFDKIDSYKGEVAFGAWLRKIIVNKSLTQLRKIKKVETYSLEQVEGRLKNEHEAMNDQQENYGKIKADEVLFHIKQLKNNYRVALTLSLIEGYDNEEIAEIMNISHENCRTTISRAKSKLRKTLSESVSINS